MEWGDSIGVHWGEIIFRLEEGSRLKGEERAKLTTKMI